MMTFGDAVIVSIKTPGFLSEYDRLTGSNLSMRGSGLDLEIDRATGRLKSEVEAFMGFVFEYVWLPLSVE